jgi:hypothetical protein
MPKHKHNRSKDSAIAIGTSHTQWIGFNGPQISPHPLAKATPDAIAELLKTLPTQPQVTPPN